MAPLRWLLHYLRKFLKVREVPRIGHLKFLSFLLGHEECSVLGRKILKTDKKEKVFSAVLADPCCIQLFPTVVF